MSDSTTILVTGGAGSIGSALVLELMSHNPTATIRVFDNSEYELAKFSRRIHRIKKDPQIRCLLGDVCDYRRLKLALKDVKYVFHLAAIKDITVSEYNPIQTIRTNIEGTINLIEACLHNSPDNVLNVSTDKVVNYKALYGATKFIGEELIRWANQVGHPQTKFATIRMGNVRETKGNVFEIWEEQNKTGLPFTVTDPDMTRYFMSLQDSVEHINMAMALMEGGDTFVPQMDKVRIGDLVKEQGSPIEVIGLRKGEIFDEYLMTDEEQKRAKLCGDLWRFV